jgi:hypothetical protein
MIITSPANDPHLPSFNSDNPFKRFLKGSDIPANPGGPAVGTVGGVVAFIELAHKTAYLFVGKRLVCPDGAVTGHDHTAFVEHFCQA